MKLLSAMVVLDEQCVAVVLRRYKQETRVTLTTEVVRGWREGGGEGNNDDLNQYELFVMSRPL